MADQIDATGLAAIIRDRFPVDGDVDGLDGDGRSALWHAAHRGELAVVVYLAQHLGASVTLPDSAGRSPLYAAAGYASGGGHLDVVRWLARNGGSVTQSRNNGATPLWAAAHSCHLETLQWLASNGGSVARPTNDGHTPLIAAAYGGHMEVVLWLACNGGSVAQQNNAGRTAADVAALNRHDSVAAFLTAASSWSAFRIMVACRRADDAKRALRTGRIDPCAGPTSLAELVAASASPGGALWAGSPDVCPATTRLVHDAMGPWAPSRHFLFHAGVRNHIHVVLLSGNRVRDRYDVPTELWERICSFFLRSDWEAPVLSQLAHRAQPACTPIFSPLPPPPP